MILFKEEFMSNLYIPNSAQIPNVFFDFWMSNLTPAEFVVLMAIARKTYGWQKEKDRISLKQLCQLTGLHKSSVIRSTERLIELKLVTKIKSKDSFDGGDAPNEYEIHINGPDHKINGGCRIEQHPPVASCDTGSERGGVASCDTQNPYIKPNNTKDMSELPFGRLASLFYEKIYAINDKVRKPNFTKWAKELSLLSRDGAGSSEEDILKVIEFVTESQPKNGFCWAHVVQCPSSLRKHFAKLWAEMNQSKKPQNDLHDNEKLAKAVVMKFKRDDIILGHNYLEFINGQYANHLKFDDKDFKHKCNSELEKRKLRLDI